jgi:hypothetical protein
MHISLSQMFEPTALIELSVLSLFYRINKGYYAARNLNLRVKLKTTARVLYWL